MWQGLKSPVLSRGQKERIVSFAKKKHEAQDINHTMDHIKLTVRIAAYLAEKESADTDVCVVAAYLHDIAKNNSTQHAHTGARMAREFLNELKAPEEFVEQVSYAISQHDNDLPKQSKEAEILWDADKLQSIGPLGFARVFGYRMVYGNRSIYSAVEAAKEYAEFFYERFYTKTGRDIARNLHNFMKEFYRLYGAIINVRLDTLILG